MANQDRRGLPPLKYWRARTAEEKHEARRSGLLPGLAATPIVLIVIVGLSSVLGDPPTWLIWVTVILVFAPIGFWAELRSARKRQERESRSD